MAAVPAALFIAEVDAETGVVTLRIAAEGLAPGTPLTVEAEAVAIPTRIVLD